MTTVHAEVDRSAVLRADRARVWATVSDVPTLAGLMPRVEAVEPVGDAWHWTVEPLNAVGYTVAPSFTTDVTLQPPERIDFRQRPDPDSQTDGGGAVVLRAQPGGTEVTFTLQLRLELPLPRLLAPAVRQMVASGLDRLGRDFLHNLDRATQQETAP